MEGENYLGIQLLRFYFRCAACSAEFILKTDPANTDYTMEKGATRNYEPWREKEKDIAQAVADRDEEERGNAMKVGQLHSVIYTTLLYKNPTSVQCPFANMDF